MDHDRIARDLEAIQTLAGAIRWAMAQEPKAEFLNVVVQDEYTHDVVLRVTPTLYVVFDTT